MKSEDMILKAAIVHILDSSVGIPVLSDQSMEVGPDFSDFLKAHIEKITESDDVKHCTFAEGSEVKELLQNCTPDNFVETSIRPEKQTAATATRSFYSAHCFRDRDSASPRRLSSISPTAP